MQIQNQEQQQQYRQPTGGAQGPPGFAGPSPLVRQLSEKVRSQAERLQVMEAYKALCEKRIQDLDPGHAMPIMPYHLGQPASAAEDSSVDISQNDLKDQIVLREQDLYYAKRENEKLQARLEEIENQGKVERQNNNFDALRKEIELNERLQKQLEVQQKKLDQYAMGQDMSGSKRNSQQLDAEVSARSLSSANNELRSLKEQLEALNDEKNALLDYIEENMAPGEGGDLKESRVVVTKGVISAGQQDKKDNQMLLDQIAELKQQNEALMRQNYMSPNFANATYAGSEYQNLPDGIHRPDENTFGNAELLQKQFAETQTKLVKEKDELNNQIQTLLNEIETLKNENQQLLTEKHILQKHLSSAQPGDISQRSHISSHSVDRGSEGGRSQSDFNYKQKAKELEQRLKANQENTKTMSYTLNETQAELESLLKEYEILRKDYDSQMKENDSMNQINRSNLQLIEELKNEKERTNTLLKDKSEQLATMEADLRAKTQQLEQERERTAQIEKHIKDLKEQESMRIQSATMQWENTVGDLSNELKNAQAEVNERQRIFDRLGQELKEKLVEAEGSISDNTKLKQQNKSLQSEVKQLEEAKNEKHRKLQHQIKKNEELLGELQALSEAVNQIKNNREFTESAQLLEEKNSQIEEYQMFMNTKHKRYMDKIFQAFLKTVEEIREFAKMYKIKAKPEDKNSNLQSFLMFDHIDAQLKSYLSLQKQQNELLQRQKVEISHSQSLKISTNMLKELELLFKSTNDLTNCMIDNFKAKERQMNELGNNLAAETNQNKTLTEQLQRLQLEETRNQQDDQTLNQELQSLQLTLVQKDREIKDVYKREEKNNKSIQRLKQQLDTVLKEQQNLLLQIKSLTAENQRLVHERKDQESYSDKGRHKEKSLEYKINSLELQVQDVNKMVENLKQAMPSEDLQTLVSEMQTLTQDHFQLNEDFALKETNLLEMENQLRIFAKSDTGLSSKVIQLRKDIKQSREELKKMQIQKIQFQEQNEQIISDLNNCENVERRRHDVALETEKSLTEAKEKIKELQKELMFVNNNRRDLEMAVQGLNEQNSMVDRELQTLRQQLHGAPPRSRSRPQSTLGGALARLRPAATARAEQPPPLYPGTAGSGPAGGPAWQSERDFGPHDWRSQQNQHKNYDQLSNEASHPPSRSTAYEPRYNPEQQSQMMNIEQNFEPRSQFSPSNVSYAAAQSQGAGNKVHGSRPRSASLGLDRPGGGIPTPPPLSGAQAPRGEYARQPDDFDRPGFSERQPESYHSEVPSDYGRQYQQHNNHYNPGSTGYHDTGHLTNVGHESEPALASYAPSNRARLPDHAPEQRAATTMDSDQQRQSYLQREQETGNWSHSQQTNAQPSALRQARDGSTNMERYSSQQHVGHGRNSINGSKDYGTFGRRNQRSADRELSSIPPSPSMPNINARGGSSTLMGQYAHGENQHQAEVLQPSFINQSADIHHKYIGGSDSKLALDPPVSRADQRSLDMPLQERTSNPAPASQDLRDSFDSNGDYPYGNRDVDTDNSMLKSSYLDKQPTTQLQTKLSQVKNVFTAIRQNLNDGSTNQSQY